MGIEGSVMRAKFITGLFLLVLPLNEIGRLRAQTQPQAIKQDVTDIEAVPDRPTFSNTPDTISKGVFEIEYGLDLAHGYQDINGLIKFGLFKDLEIRFGEYPLVHDIGTTGSGDTGRFGDNPIVPDTGSAGFGDSGAGIKYRFLKQKGLLPAVSVLYTLSIPTAMSELESGAVGHSVALLVGKDFGKHRLDFNESIQWVGRPGAGGFDRNYFTALSYSHPLTARLGFSEEVAGYSRTNADVGAALTVLQTLNLAVSPRLVFDGGCYFTVMGDLPQVVFFTGVTYAVGDLYRFLRRNR